MLSLSGNNLEGEIPAEIGNLEALQDFFLDHNHLTGTIPSGIGKLTKLEILVLSHNCLSGHLPEEILDLISLSGLYLDHNELTGSLPEEIDRLSLLMFLDLRNNQFSGTIPAAIGDHTLLWALYLNNNHFSGSVPEAINRLSYTRIMRLDNNELDGLPVLTIPYLDTLDVSRNKLSFEDILPNTGFKCKSYTYLPQDSIGSALDTICKSSAILDISVFTGGVNNKYELRKNEAKFLENSNGSFRFTSLKPSDSGTYYWAITNPAVHEMTLFSKLIRLKVSEEEIVRTRIYPNPANEKIRIDFNEEYYGLSRIEIINLKGSLIMQEFTKDKSPEVDIRHLPRGIYLVRIQNSYYYTSEKIIKY